MGISSVEIFIIIIPNKPHKDLENIGIIVQNYIAVTDMSFWFFSLNFFMSLSFSECFSQPIITKNSITLWTQFNLVTS